MSERPDGRPVDGETALALRGVVKTFRQGERSLEILRGAELELKAGELAALVGPSGAGKSTLLHIAGLLERPDAGEVHLAGQRADNLSDGRRTAIRGSQIGFVYQYHHLLPEFTALENLMVPQRIAGLSRRQARARAGELLRSVGLGERLEHRPGRLSGGEQQRVAIARAIVNRPRVLLADEPTGNLDPETAEGVFKMLVGLVRATGLAALVATHNLELARRMDRVVALSDGRLVPQ
ncbi:lipoprotein-releasing system ATP-binding protein [Tistlia consotensis]|uniref:Lipoprotein-releasing system ATP-binding protein n=1 Tax=Tistlia consotensis USBA 355 TaxID=560819 RepID=A0A1Y6CL84_9PROT|nr:ABC transporter ATP-binding protein [Tistlia consotensis]SMF70609.1 lipoprotein-releasing system ATP-binding protein [Tistlia consotensis USBA 355]SNS04391.1 lipoprotein-releasing system ATP-binding protein [Tistlia consotensis]